jgi:hypothetical protein
MHPISASLPLTTKFVLTAHNSLSLIMDTQVEANQEVLFRPFKRRKFQRRRPDDTDSQQESPASNDASVTQDPQSDVETVQTADALRLRRLQRSRKGGIEFSATSRPTAGQASKTSLPTTTAEDTEGDRLRAMCDRFTAHTGQTVDVDKHMYGSPSHYL